MLYSVDFQEVERLQHRGDWGGASRLLAAAAVALRAAGAEAIVICTNTMHKVAEAVEQASGLPLIHIADATALQVREKTFAASGCWARVLPWSRPSIAAACRNCTASMW